MTRCDTLRMCCTNFIHHRNLFLSCELRTLIVITKVPTDNIATAQTISSQSKESMVYVVRRMGGEDEREGGNERISWGRAVGRAVGQGERKLSGGVRKKIQIKEKRGQGKVPSRSWRIGLLTVCFRLELEYYRKIVSPLYLLVPAESSGSVRSGWRSSAAVRS